MTERQNCMTIADMFNHIVHWGFSVLWNSNGIDFIPILPSERASVPPVSLGPSEAWGILVPTLLWWLSLCFSFHGITSVSCKQCPQSVQPQFSWDKVILTRLLVSFKAIEVDVAIPQIHAGILHILLLKQTLWPLIWNLLLMLFLCRFHLAVLLLSPLLHSSPSLLHPPNSKQHLRQRSFLLPHKSSPSGHFPNQSWVSP